MPPFPSRLAYITEFLVAIGAVILLWSQAGGQGHLDLIPWYWKLGLILPTSALIVMATMAASSHDRALNAKTVTCLVLIALLGAAMGFAAYYAHLHENDDNGAEDEGAVAIMINPLPAEAQA